MLTLSLTEIRDRAQAFANSWAGETRENAEAKSFWDGFFQVFGRNRREVASFEDPVKKITGTGKNFIDLLWNGNGAFVGDTMQLGLATNATTYMQYYLGVGYEYEPFTFGVKFKYLNGIADFSTSSSNTTE